MPSLAQLAAEVWWQREIVTPELRWLGDELCRRTGRPAIAFGTKGDEFHLKGAHRSQEWILRSAYCTNRSYTVQAGLTAEQARHIAGADWTPGAWGTAANRALMADQTRRLVDAARAGQLTGIIEIIGTLDGRTVYGYRVTTGTTFPANSSHLDHWHLTLDRWRMTDRSLMERILAVALGEDDDMSWDEKIGTNYAPVGYGDHLFRTAVGYTWAAADNANRKLEALSAEVRAAAAADEVRDKATLAAVEALAAAGGVDAAPVVAAVTAVRDEARQRFAALETALAAAEAERDELRTQLAAVPDAVLAELHQRTAE